MKDFGYDSCDVDLLLQEALKKYNAEKDFETWLGASLIVQGNQGDIDYYPTFYIPETVFGNNHHGKVELQLHVFAGSQSYYSPQSGDIDLDYLRVDLQVIQVHKLIKYQVLQYIQSHPGATKQEIAKALNMQPNFAIHNALAEICYRQHLVEEVSGPEIGYKEVVDKPQDVQTLFREADKDGKVRMLTEETDIYKLKDMLKTLACGPCSPAFNVEDNVNDLLGPIWPMPLIKAKDLLAKEHGKMWSYAGD